MFTTTVTVPSLIGLLYLGDQIRPGFAAAAVVGFTLAVAGAIDAGPLRIRRSAPKVFGRRGRIALARPEQGPSATQRHVRARLISLCTFRTTSRVQAVTVVEAGAVVLKAGEEMFASRRQGRLRSCLRCDVRHDREAGIGAAVEVAV